MGVGRSDIELSKQQTKPKSVFRRHPWKKGVIDKRGQWMICSKCELECLDSQLDEYDQKPCRPLRSD